MLGLYLHIPFCRTICPYCDFVKRPIKGAAPTEFIDAVIREIDAFEGPCAVDSVFFGGGTPSLVLPESLEAVLDAMRKRFQFAAHTEITLEANPDDVTTDLVRAWKDVGVNRVSLGVQSFNDDALRYLGRRHDADGARRACRAVADQFSNWNIDLIFGVPPYDAWAETLAEGAGMGSTHVSAYGLTYEAGTPFGRRTHEAVDDDTYLDQYRLAEERLAGFDRYEVSNFARPGFACVHNLHYWHNEEYVGFGPGAYSYVLGCRARNHVGIEDYLRDPGGKAESLRLSEEEVRLETVIQYLRLADGIARSVYGDRFGRSLDHDYGETLRELVACGLLRETAGGYRPTQRGFELNNEIGLALVSVRV